MGWEFYFLNYEYIDEFPEDSCRLETEQLGFDILRRQELRKNGDLTCVVSRTGLLSTATDSTAQFAVVIYNVRLSDQREILVIFVLALRLLVSGFFEKTRK